MKNIEAQGRIGALIVWINSADAMRPIGSIRKALCSRMRKISDAFDDQDSDWQPIDTAPKDGTSVIAFVPGFGMGTFVLFWMDGYWREPANMMGLKVKPTHWMPLPSPPKAEGPDEVGEQVRAVSGEPA